MSSASGKVLGDFLTSISGNVDKALLCVYALPEQLVKQSDENSTKEVEAQLNQARTKMEALYNMLHKGEGDQSQASRTERYKNTTNSKEIATLEVNYNPSSISFNSSVGQRSWPIMDGKEGGQYIMDVPEEIIMNVDLLFDDVNVKDAFMWEKFRLSIGDIVSGTQAVKRYGKEPEEKIGDGFSVQIPIDGIVSLIAHQITRQAMFIWNKMIFSGEIISARAKYTMFNPKGHPIRGTVSLSIKQGLAVVSKSEHKYWLDAFDKLFAIDDKNRMTDLEKDSSETFSSLGNLIQF